VPFKSKAQQGFMYAKHPKIAARWEDETPDMKHLPMHVKKANRHKKSEMAALKRHIHKKFGD